MSERRVLVNENSLIAIGSAIREKKGTDASYKPGDMAAAILEIQTGIEPVGDITITENGEYDVVNYAKAIVEVAGSGGGGDVEIPVITGDCQYRFAYNGWNWAVEAFGKQMRTEDISTAQYMFFQSTQLTEIPFELNFKTQTSGSSCANMLGGCYQLKEIPKFNNCKINDMASMFSGCYRLREISEDKISDIDFSGFDNSTSAYSFYSSQSIFKDCYSLRKFPMEFLKHENPISTSAYSSKEYNTFSYCYVLDEVLNYPVHEKWSSLAMTSNLFQYTFNSCCRLKNFTFETNEDGTPKIVKWKSQIIDLTFFVGNANNDFNITGYNSGITIDKKVYDDASYQALKNDPDWYSTDEKYSRYNHDSAIATINTLPDTSAYLATAGGTNTIKFKGAAGALTDGGAINTMTDAEIAVAAAKGWTVSFS